MIINKESSYRLERDLGFESSSLKGVARILRACGYCPSAERMAVVAMVVPDVTDEDIAEWWGRDLHWAREVRANQDYWRRAEPFAAQLEYIDEGYHPSYPSPEEIAERAAAISARKPMTSKKVGIDNFQWNGKRGTFVHISAE